MLLVLFDTIYSIDSIVLILGQCLIDIVYNNGQYQIVYTHFKLEVLKSKTNFIFLV